MLTDIAHRGTSLLAHQVEGVEWILRTPKGLIADEAGLGKTPQALVAIQRLVSEGLPRGQSPTPANRRLARVLWITDASLLTQTKAEAERFAPQLTVLNGHDPELGLGVRAQRLMAEKFPSGVDLLILSYETARTRRRWLGHFGFSMLVLDEVSAVKSGGKQFETVRELAARTPRVLSMTATPIENDPTELWAILRATDAPDLWSRRVFEEEFVTWRTTFVDQRGRSREVPDGWQEQRLSEVREYLAKVSLRRTHASVGTRRPLRREVAPVEVPLTPAQTAAYEAAQKSGGRSAVRRMEVASLVDGEESPLLSALVRELDKRPGESAIVYCETLEILDVVEAKLRDHGLTTCRIEGKVNENSRREAIERHRAGEAHVLLASRVLEYGLNLQHCRLLISLDTSWNPARETQREGRICRLGSPHDDYEHVVIRPSTALAKAKAERLERKLRNAALVGLA